jgi:hypothetical protein
MAWAKVQKLLAVSISNTGGALSQTATWATANITTSNRIIVHVNANLGGAGGVVTVADSAGNTYTQIVAAYGNNGTNWIRTEQWSAPITAGGGTKPTITVSTTAALVYAAIAFTAEEVSGLSTSAGAGCLDTSAVSPVEFTSTTAAVAGPTGNAANANEYVVSTVGCEGDNATTTFTVSASSPTLTKDAGLTVEANSVCDVVVADGNSTNGATCSCSWTPSAADGYMAVTVAYFLAGQGAVTSKAQQPTVSRAAAQRASSW